jgi:hypothetical protein
MDTGTVNFVSLTDREIFVQGHTSRPQSFTIKKHRDPTKQAQGPESYHAEEKHEHKFEGFGLYWEADAVARTLRGELEIRLFRRLVQAHGSTRSSEANGQMVRRSARKCCATRRPWSWR